MGIKLLKLVKSKFNPLSANFTKWSNTLKKFVGNLSTTCLSVFDDFVGLVLKGLSVISAVIFVMIKPNAISKLEPLRI